jgi:flavorubredoxin
MEAVMQGLNVDIYNDNNVEIAEGVYWVGFDDKKTNLHCNSYLIVDNNEAVLIDSGSRNDFSTVMLKIMRAGVSPNSIIRLIYQHYDPDLCGNLPQMEAMINNDELAVLSHHENNVFIDYYSTKTRKHCIKEQDYYFTFSSGRRLEFIHTPFSHTFGSFMTYDTKTKTLFSSDILGSYDTNWELYTHIDESCLNCAPTEICRSTGKLCEIVGMWDFHKRVMPSEKALKYALKKIESLDVSLIAPQHGSILHTPISRKIYIDQLKSLSNIGIEYYLREEHENE